MTIEIDMPKGGVRRLLVFVGLPLALVMAAATVARAYDTTWIASGQAVSSSKLKADLDEAQSRLGALEKHAAWSGYLGTNCVWKVPTSQTTFADPVDSATCALVETANTNFGTVTMLGAKPGIVFAPPAPGAYEVCVSTSVSGEATGGCGYIFLQLLDDTNVIAEQGVYADGSLHSLAFCGIATAATMANKTLKLQVAMNGTAAIDIRTFAPGTRAVNWTLARAD